MIIYVIIRAQSYSPRSKLPQLTVLYCCTLIISGGSRAGAAGAPPPPRSWSKIWNAKKTKFGPKYILSQFTLVEYKDFVPG